jgi:hypothetical protein
VKCQPIIGGDRDGDEDGDHMGTLAGIGLFLFLGNSFGPRW